jgi:hypothetical protein
MDVIRNSSIVCKRNHLNGERNSENYGSFRQLAARSADDAGGAKTFIRDHARSISLSTGTAAQSAPLDPDGRTTAVDRERQGEG